MLQNKTLRNERMGSSRIKQNRGRYCVDRERTEHDVWGILCFFPGHVVYVTLPVVVAGVEVVALGGWIVPTIDRLGCRVSWLRALFSIMPLLTTSIAGDPWTVCEFLISGMELSDGPWLSSRGSPLSVLGTSVLPRLLRARVVLSLFRLRISSRLRRSFSRVMALSTSVLKSGKVCTISWHLNAGARPSRNFSIFLFSVMCSS